MNQLLNESEKLVYNICKKSFLSLWSYANPIGKNSKELCDILVVCHPDIIIISVKDVKLTDSGDISTDWNRWTKRAIDSSIKQIYGAERWIENAKHVIRNDGSIGIKLPEHDDRRIHRIAIALGSEGEVPITFGDHGKGFVHVFDRESLKIIMTELDTIGDFVDYLIFKEKLYASGKTVLISGGEENLLALYLNNGINITDNLDVLVVDNDLWDLYKESREYKAKKDADELSYSWDRIIEILCNDILHGNLEFGPDLNDSELAVRTMARENRFGRRMLGKAFLDFFELARQGKVRSRMALGNSNTTYVFLALPHDEDRVYRKAELSGRCLVARVHNKDCSTVVGLATERYEKSKGFSFDLLYLYLPEVTDELRKQAEYAKYEFSFFANPQFIRIHEEEYPHDKKDE